ncbi:MAG: transposase [Planctomycetes bacterium]|nr:transposase [Planctomycetota bacterium]
MPRIARAVAVGFPHHVIQRGNNREKIFFAEVTREKYLNWLKEYADTWGVKILAYCLMTNHIHLLVKPDKMESLAKMMQGLNVSYTRYINKRYKRTGRLLEGRYHSCIIDEEPYLWAVARYIEQNPLRAGMVKAPEEYPYSSARAHITGQPNEALTDELITEDDRSDYTEFIKAPSPKREIERIRITTKRGMPLGGDIFVERLERRLKRRFTKKKSGRPHK